MRHTVPFFFSLILEFLKWKSLRRKEDILERGATEDFRRKLIGKV